MGGLEADFESWRKLRAGLYMLLHHSDCREVPAEKKEETRLILVTNETPVTFNKILYFSVLFERIYLIINYHVL